MYEVAEARRQGLDDRVLVAAEGGAERIEADELDTLELGLELPREEGKDLLAPEHVVPEEADAPPVEAARPRGGLDRRDGAVAAGPENAEVFGWSIHGEANLPVDCHGTPSTPAQGDRIAG